MADPLHLIRGTCPTWFACADQVGPILRGVASLTVNALDAVIQYDLEIHVIVSVVRVREVETGAKLPRRCSERHIEVGGWFCLGLDAGMHIQSASAASAWWRGLEKFLRLQRTASRSGIWPDQHALSHGAAGIHHQSAILIAAELGLEEEYDAMVMGAPSALDQFAGLLRPGGARFRNGRAACSCGKQSNGRRTHLRRKCSRLRSILTILAEEQARKAKLASFWESERTIGTRCCGTMKTCPLQLTA